MFRYSEFSKNKTRVFNLQNINFLYISNWGEKNLTKPLNFDFDIHALFIQGVRTCVLYLAYSLNPTN